MAQEKIKQAQELLTKPWRKFLDKLHEDRPAIHKWEPIHLLGHNLEQFKSHYGIEYSLSYSGPPSKCTEIVLTKRLFSVLNNTNPALVKEYIDWVWEKKIKKGQLKIKTISFFNSPGIANEFKFYWQDKNKITKTTPLPVDYTEIISDLNIPISTYGDLLFIKAILAENTNAEETRSYQEVIKRLQSIGFEEKILVNI